MHIPVGITITAWFIDCPVSLEFCAQTHEHMRGIISDNNYSAVVKPVLFQSTYIIRRIEIQGNIQVAIENDRNRIVLYVCNWMCWCL